MTAMASTENSNYRPEPTRLVLLEEVGQQEAGTKIRFLASVHEYNVTSGILMLRDEYPVTSDHGHTVVAKVDNEMLSLKTELLQVGAWLNVIGYVRKPLKAKMPAQRGPGKKTSKSATKVPLVDATMVWSAGAIQHDKYQTALKAYQTTS